jgi:hypothetical protein
MIALLAAAARSIVLAGAVVVFAGGVVAAGGVVLAGVAVRPSVDWGVLDGVLGISGESRHPVEKVAKGASRARPASCGANDLWRFFIGKSPG